MRIPFRILLISAVTIAVSFVIVTAYSTRSDRPKPESSLGIEIALVKPFYVPAARDGKSLKVVVRVPATSVNSADAVSAIKLEPRMDGDKVKVAVYALVGSTANIKKCSDWDALKSTLVDTYIAGVDEEVVLTKLRDFGVSMATNPLTFRVVPTRTLSPVPDGSGGGCGCGSCGGLICCPNPGYCLGCGECGDVCCSGSGGN